MAHNFPQTLCLIQSQPASNSTTIDFTGKITSSFSTYLVKMSDIIPATNNANLLLTFSVDNGANFLASNYKWTNKTSTSNAGNAASQSASDSSIRIADTLQNGASNGLCGDLQLYDMNNGTLVPKCYAMTTMMGSGPVGVVTAMGGMNTGVTAINAIRFAMSSGNITSGTFTLYGIQEP